MEDLTRRRFIEGSLKASALAATTSMVNTMQTTIALADTADAPVRPGAPLLLVRDLDTVARYYEQAIGLHVLNKDKDEAQLGAGSRLLLTLRQRPNVDLEPQGFAGLFHTAFLMPDRPSLGRWLLRAIEDQVPFVGAADHLVSEALYLQDPEGNGIEVYADRPREQWKWNGDTVHMDSLELDVRGIVTAGGTQASPTSRVPDGMTVGHIHLRVGGIPEAEAFYNGILNFAVTSRMSGATFYSTGKYHHHIATNTWGSQGAPKRSGSITGLSSFDLIAKDQAAHDAMAEHMLAKGGKRDGGLVALPDPWGNLVQLRKA